MIAFIDDHREAHGVEPICKVLPIAPSTYYDHVAGRRDPARLSARAKRDMALKVEVRRVFEENFRGYGVRKAWRQLRREGFDVARCAVERLMREVGFPAKAPAKSPRSTVPQCLARGCPAWPHPSRFLRRPGQACPRSSWRRTAVKETWFMSRSAARAHRSSRAKERAGMCGPWRSRRDLHLVRVVGNSPDGLAGVVGDQQAAIGGHGQPHRPPEHLSG